jgi:selenocysteine-specific translation elongation factor
MGEKFDKIRTKGLPDERPHSCFSTIIDMLPQCSWRRMRHLTVGIFHDDAIGRELGKKEGTESDIVMFNRKMDERIFTFMSPLDDKLSAKSQIISNIDAAVVTFAEMTRELGETVVMLDSLDVSKGIAVTSFYATPDQITAIIKETSLASFIIGKRDPGKMLQVLKNFDTARDSASPVMVVVDHSFSVKGVGEVILGFVKKGIVSKYDELTLLPANKSVIVRSIQMQDEDFDEAEAGARVGLAIKGATVEEMKRGSVICASEDAKTGVTVKLSYKKSIFYPDDIREGAFHATVGMQTIPVMITGRGETSLTIESEKPIVYAPEDTFLLLDLNAKKTRIMAKAYAVQD